MAAPAFRSDKLMTAGSRLHAGNTLVDGIAASNFGNYLHLSAKDSEATRHAAGVGTEKMPISAT